MKVPSPGQGVPSAGTRRTVHHRGAASNGIDGRSGSGDEGRSAAVCGWRDRRLGGFAMNYGLYLSASGALTSLHRQDVLANNLANINTVGFKPDMVTTRARLAERLESPGAPIDPQFL